MIEILISLVIAGILGVVVYTYVPVVFGQAKRVSLADAARDLNSVSEQFLGAGGRFPPDGTADSFLLLLQTPVDAASRKAGYGNFAQIDYQWTLRSIRPEDAGSRLVTRYDAGRRRPVWSITESGPGFEIVRDGTRNVPPIADWTARVDSAGVIGARTSSWVWEEGKGIATAGRDDPIATGGSGGGPPGTAPRLKIDGPTTITSLGTFYWTGLASVQGTLTIFVGDLQQSASGATSVLSVKKTFSAGDRGNLLIRLTRAEGGDVSQTVSYDIPETPVVSIDGPDQITNLSSALWTANANVRGTPISIRVEGFPEKSADNASTLTSDPVTWPPGTTKEIKVTAAVVNGSGIGRAEKIVRLQIPPPPTGNWFLADGVTPVPTGYRITSRGSYSFVFRGTNAGGPGSITVTTSGPCSGGQNLSAENAIALSTAAMTVDFGPGDDRTFGQSGTIQLYGKLTTPVDSCEKALAVDFSFPAINYPASWTATVLNATSVNSITIYLNGQPVATNKGQSSLSYSVFPGLSVGTYNVSASAFAIDSKGALVNPQVSLGAFIVDP